MNATDHVVDEKVYHIVRYSGLQLLNILIILLNAFVIKVVTKSSQLQSATFVFLANQSASDILFAVAGSLYTFVCYHGIAHPSAGLRLFRLGCETSNWLIWTGYVLSAWFLAAIAFERFASLYFPFRNPLKPKPVAIVLWSLALVTQFVFVIDYRSMTFLASPKSFHSCFQSFIELADNWFIQSLIGMKLSIFISHWIPFFLIGVFSLAIIVKILTLKSVGDSTTHQQRDQDKKVKVVKMLLLIIFVYYALTAPVNYYLMADLFGIKRFKCSSAYQPFNVPIFFQIVTAVARLACISNPIILIMFNDHFRYEMQKVLHCGKVTANEGSSSGKSGNVNTTTV